MLRSCAHLSCRESCNDLFYEEYKRTRTLERHYTTNFLAIYFALDETRGLCTHVFVQNVVGLSAENYLGYQAVLHITPPRAERQSNGPLPQ
jgi:hypothetical protein